MWLKNEKQKKDIKEKSKDDLKNLSKRFDEQITHEHKEAQHKAKQVKKKREQKAQEKKQKLKPGDSRFDKDFEKVKEDLPK